MRDFLRQFMLYSRSERRAVVALVLLIAIVLLIPQAYHFYGTKAQVSFADTTISKDLAALGKSDAVNYEGIDSFKHQAHGELFYFDPNTIGAEDWVRLGLTGKQAAVIEKYKAKGGRFYHPDDLRKIFVMSEEMKERLVPYVKISESALANNKQAAKAFYSIEINTADSAAFEALYGIGPALSRRIVKFRGLLGGFYRIEQVGETYGVSDSTYQLIKPHLTVNPGLVIKMDINSADYETLRKHPYIHAKIAHAIIAYRGLNGKFENLEELKTLKPMTDDIYKKIGPYLKVGDKK